MFRLLKSLTKSLLRWRLISFLLTLLRQVLAIAENGMTESGDKPIQMETDAKLHDKYYSIILSHTQSEKGLLTSTPKPCSKKGDAIEERYKCIRRGDL
ncbi:hypothetical protein AAHA92_10488 [Salvia divinorum]|uniref:Secreted protein n=1 Tax=Salvia divinorum TaxID=28513 RepID=A0ABD1HUU1_SALDI